MGILSIGFEEEHRAFLYGKRKNRRSRKTAWRALYKAIRGNLKTKRDSTGRQLSVISGVFVRHVHNFLSQIPYTCIVGLLNGL